MSEKPKQKEANPKKKGFVDKIRRVGRGVKVAAGLAALYLGVSSTSYMRTVSAPAQIERYEPRAVHVRPPWRVRQTLEHALYYLNEGTGEFRDNVTHSDYNQARCRAFGIANVDDTNPKDNAERYKFYRELGVAVIASHNPNMGVYIPYATIKSYVEKNSPKPLCLPQGLKECIGKPRGSFSKEIPVLLGKVFFKADSKAEGGNEDGVVNVEEWARALHKMGYTTIEYQILQLKQELEKDPTKAAKTIKTIDSLVKQMKEQTYRTVDGWNVVGINNDTTALKNYISS